MAGRDLDSARARALRSVEEELRIELRSDRAILSLDGLDPPEWATRFGWYEFGLFADFAIGGVAVPLRWIPPGELEMGSPEDEPGRVLARRDAGRPGAVCRGDRRPAI